VLVTVDLQMPGKYGYGQMTVHFLHLNVLKV